MPEEASWGRFDFFGSRSPSGASPGTFLGPYWPVFGGSWAVLVPSWWLLGAVLGAFWAGRSGHLRAFGEAPQVRDGARIEA